MGILHLIDPATGVLFERWEGLITADDVSDYWTWYTADPASMACSRELADVRKAEFEFSGAELRRLVEEYLVDMDSKVDFKLAILVEKPVQIGLSRQYQVFANLVGHDQVFTDEAAALAWLGLPPEPGIPTEGFVSHRDQPEP